MSLQRSPKQLAKLIDYVLSRRPDEFGLVIDSEGYIKIKELLKALNEEKGFRHVRRSHLNEILYSIANPPFEIADNAGLDTFVRGLWEENPVFVMLLGMCPVLAVTNSTMNALAMGLATLFVLVMSNIVVSSLRSFIPKEVRIATYILIIATFVTVVDYAIQAISLDLYKALGAFISLIVVNCLILGRQESFASRQPVRLAVADAAGMSLGFTIALSMIGAIREIEKRGYKINSVIGCSVGAIVGHLATRQSAMYSPLTPSRSRAVAA